MCCLLRGQHGHWQRGSPICSKEVRSRPQQPQAICHGWDSVGISNCITNTAQKRISQWIGAEKTCPPLAPLIQSIHFLFGKCGDGKVNDVSIRCWTWHDMPFFLGLLSSSAAWGSQSCCRKMRRQRCENELKRRGGIQWQLGLGWFWDV